MLTTSGDSVSDGSRPNDYVSRAFIYLPYFVAGYVAKRHSLFDAYLEFARERVSAGRLVRFLAIAWLLGLFVIAAATHKSLYSLAGLSGSGCESADVPIGQLPPWPATLRWPQVGCILNYQLLFWPNLLAVLLAMPYDHVPFVTAAGGRTLTGYTFLQVRPAGPRE